MPNELRRMMHEAIAKRLRDIGLLACVLLGGCRGPEAEAVQVNDLAGLVAAAARDGQVVRMAPGTYRLSDLLPAEAIEAMRKAGNLVAMTFAGSGNRFELDGVVIEWETEIREKLKGPVHTNDIEVTGANNIISGLEIRCTGDGTSPGGALLSIRGPGNTLKGCRFLVRGSFPYGYGDVFGKGGGSVIPHRKHSGVHIIGSRTTLENCHLEMRSFGHGYYVQEEARDVVFESCGVVGVMRSTDEMLGETEGPAFQKDFRTVFRNREGRETLLPGYMKSLSEDGFRTYAQNTVTLRNCTAKHMRGGFELRTKQGVRLENCTAVGCERGFWLSDGAVAENCRGDARFGPLLFLEGRGAKVELEVLPEIAERNVHALATIHGTDHRVTLRPAETAPPEAGVPVLIGYSAPPAGEGMAPFGEQVARNVELRNETAMPVVLGPKSEGCEVASRGEVLENHGKNPPVSRLAD